MQITQTVLMQQHPALTWGHPRLLLEFQMGHMHRFLYSSDVLPPRSLVPGVYVWYLPLQTYLLLLCFALLYCAFYNLTARYLTSKQMATHFCCSTHFTLVGLNQTAIYLRYACISLFLLSVDCRPQCTGFPAFCVVGTMIVVQPELPLLMAQRQRSGSWDVNWSLKNL